MNVLTMNAFVRRVALPLLGVCVSLSENAKALPETSLNPELVQEASRTLHALAADWSAEDRGVIEAEIHRVGRLGDILLPESSMLSPSQDYAMTQRDAVIPQEMRLFNAFSCIKIAKSHFEAKGQVYRSLIREFSPALGMRQDDLLRVVMHDAWAACYVRASEGGRPLTESGIAPEEAWKLLRPLQDPARFSSIVQEELDEAVAFFTETKDIYGPQAEWLRALAAVAFIFAALVVAFYCINQLWRRRPSSPASKILRRVDAPRVQLSAAKRL